MAINFPNSPSLNDTFTVSGITFTWNGSVWNSNVGTEISSDATPVLGGNLDGGAKNINNVGVITATSFSGSLTGDVVGNVTGTATSATTATTATYATTAGVSTNAQGLTGTPNITVGTIGCGNVTSSGDVSATNATFSGNATVSGNLTVNGTTTTIDTAVTSVDSLAVDGRITGAGITVSGVGDLAVSQSTQGQSATLFLGKGGSSKVFSVDESGNLKIGSNLDSASTTNITLGTSGSALFAGDVQTSLNILVRGSDNNGLFIRNGANSAWTTEIKGNGNATFAGTVSDSMGPLRRLGINFHNAATYTLVAGDAGKLIREATNAATITIPQNVFSAGDMISIFNVSGGDNTITQGTGTTLYNTADGSSGNRTLAAKGVCTIVCTSTNEFIISGSGLS